MLLGITTTLNIVSENDTIERQTSVIVYSYILFFYLIKSHCVLTCLRTGSLTTLPSNETHFQEKYRNFTVYNFAISELHFLELTVHKKFQNITFAK